MQSKQQYQAYANATQTVAKTRQIVMLYDGVISFLQQAKIALQEKRIEDRYNLLVKASAIINGLQACLDFEKGEQIAKVLYNFYADVGGRIFSVHRTQNVQTLDDAIADLKKMRDVWNEIDEGDAAAAEAVADESDVPAATPVDVPKSDSSDENVTLSA
jgi:flagellar secretion chaperone FliS